MLAYTYIVQCTNCLCSYSVELMLCLLQYQAKVKIHGQLDGPAFWEWKIQGQLQVFGQVDVKWCLSFSFSEVTLLPRQQFELKT